MKLQRSQKNQSRLSARRDPCLGQTLLELIAATVLIGAALVPALKLMRDGMKVGRETETRNLLAIYCDGELERQLALAGATWTSGTPTGDFAADGYANIRYSAQVSDSPADGGISDRLMAISVTVWDDEDGDTILDASEPSVVMRSKTSKLASYENEAQN